MQFVTKDIYQECSLGSGSRWSGNLIKLCSTKFEKKVCS